MVLRVYQGHKTHWIKLPGKSEYRCLSESEEAVGFSEAGVTGGCEMPNKGEN